jgi:hypothetical protein
MIFLFCFFVFNLQDLELAIKGKFDAVLDTIGVPETERLGINFLKRGGHYMTLQVGDSCFVFSNGNSIRFFPECCLISI